MELSSKFKEANVWKICGVYWKGEKIFNPNCQFIIIRAFLKLRSIDDLDTINQLIAKIIVEIIAALTFAQKTPSKNHSNDDLDSSNSIWEF